MENKTTIFSLGLDKNDKSLLSKIIKNNDNITLKNSLGILELFELARIREIKYLVIKYEDNVLNDLEFIFQNRGYFVMINVLFVSSNGSKLKKIVPSKYMECFNRVDFFETDGKLIENTSAFFEFITSEGSQEIGSIYIPLDFKIFSNIKKASCDIFIKLSDVKYIKILSKGDDQGPKQVISKYTDKGVKELYIHLKDLEQFRDFFKEEIFAIDQNASIVDQKLQIAESVIAVARDFGVSQYLVDGINNSFDEISKELSVDKKLESILKLLKESEGSVIANHSYLTAIFATLICSKTSWSTSRIKKNLSLASILHDIELTNSPHISYEFKSLEEINTLDSKSATTFKNHGTLLAETLSKNNSIPSDVINLISKHHEGSHGNSYPLGIPGGQLSPPNCLFNVAHRFSIELSKVAFNYQKLELVFTRLREHYAGGAMFKSFIDILESELSPKK